MDNGLFNDCEDTLTRDPLSSLAAVASSCSCPFSVQLSRPVQLEAGRAGRAGGLGIYLGSIIVLLWLMTLPCRRRIKILGGPANVGVFSSSWGRILGAHTRVKNHGTHTQVYAVSTASRLQDWGDQCLFDQVDVQEVQSKME